MHIENLSHWSGNLNREMYLNVMGMLGFQLWSLLHQVAVTMNTMILA